MYNDHLPAGCGNLPGESPEEEAYEQWFDEAETRLLDDFTREYLVPMYGLNVPLTKDWDKHDQSAWRKWVDKAWEDESEAYL